MTEENEKKLIIQGTGRTSQNNMLLAGEPEPMTEQEQAKVEKILEV